MAFDLQTLRSFVNERLCAAAEEIFVVVERIITEYDAQAFSSEQQIEQQQRIMDVVFKPDIKLHRTECSPEQQERSPSGLVVREGAERSPSPSGLLQEEAECPQIKEEQDDLQTPREADDDEGSALTIGLDLLLLPHVCKEDPPEQQERSPSLVGDQPEPPQIKEEQEELLLRPEEADGSTSASLDAEVAGQQHSFRCLECPCDQYEPQKDLSACGYCGHAPGQHTHESTAPPETPAVSKFDRLSEKRKLSLGWHPHPKSAKTLFLNKILPAFYQASYPVCNDKLFQKDLMLERNRSFKITKTLDHVEAVMEFVCGPNPAAGGRFLQAGFKIKGKHDIVTCRQNIEKLEKIPPRLAEEMARVEEHDNSLLQTDGLHLRPGQASRRALNAKMKARIKRLRSRAESAVKRLEAARQRLRTFFVSDADDSGPPSRFKRMKKQYKRKAIKKKAQRTKRREEELIQDLFPEASPDFTITADMVVVQKLAAVTHLQGTRLCSLLQRLQATEEARALITANLGEAGRRGFQEGHRALHAECSGDCASADCPFYERAAGVFRSLGGQTHRALYAPSHTGLPQLSVTELEVDVLEEMEFTPELAALVKAGCFDEEAAGVVQGASEALQR